MIFLLAVGIFFYGRILTAQKSSKDTALAAAEAKIDPATVEGFVRLRDRLLSGENLLAKHVAFSGFFSSIGGLMPTTVRFASLDLSVDDTGTIQLEGSGTAKNFNALAAVSLAFAQDGRIKNAIFSDIKVSIKDGSVTFALAATLDPKIVAFLPASPVALPNITASSTASYATTTP